MASQNERTAAKRRWMLVAAGTVGVLVLICIAAARLWDNPPPEKGMRIFDSNLVEDGRITGTASIVYDGPPILVEGQRQVMQLEIRLGKFAPSPTPAAPTQTPGTPAASSPEMPGGILREAEMWMWGDASDIRLIGGSLPVFICNVSQLEQGCTAHARLIVETTGLQPTLTFHFQPAKIAAQDRPWLPGELGQVFWTPACRQPFALAMEPFAYAALAFGLVLVGLLYYERRHREVRRQIQEQLAEASTREGADPTWEVARIKLEAYFDRNLIQINLIFWLAVIVMFIGFGFVLAGVLIAQRVPPAPPRLRPSPAA
jgi:hypothetical protein